MCLAISATEITAQSVPNIAPNTQTNCDADLKECSQFLDQSLAEVKAAKSLIETLKAENESRKQKDAIQEGIIKAQGDLILILQKQTRRKVSFAFGLIKISY